MVTLHEAQLLFQFFDQNMSQQLFGFELRNFRVDELWMSSPILVGAMCTIALIHFSDAALSSKQPYLQEHLRRLCTSAIFDAAPNSDLEVLNDIVVLIL